MSTGGYVAMSNADKNMIIGSYQYGEMYRSNEFGGNAQTFYSWIACKYQNFRWW